MTDSLPTRKELRKGIEVSIVEKKNQKSGEETVGKIDELLTNSETHPYGIKVRLEDGRVGRVKRIVKESGNHK